MAADTTAELCALMATTIAAIDGTPFAKGVSKTFRQSKVILSSVEGSAALSHLAFCVYPEDLPSDKDYPYQGQRLAWIDGVFVVELAFHLRSTEQTDDVLKAMNAAEAIAAALVRDCQVVTSRQPIRLANMGRPRLVHGEWYIIQQRYRIGYEVAV